MQSFNKIKEYSDISEEDKGIDIKIKQAALDKFDELMEDNELANPINKPVRLKDGELMGEKRYEELFETESFSNIDNNSDEDINATNKETKYDKEIATKENIFDVTQQKEPNEEYEVNGDIYKSDETGRIYKKNGELIADIDYVQKGNRYHTDEEGRIQSCEGTPIYTIEGSRNIKEQMESGGEERLQDDDGGHIIAKILGGAEGSENLVPMRRTINRGDYKKMENEISQALQSGKEVTLYVTLEYEGDSKRPSKMEASYVIDGKKTIVEFDNDQDSIDLIDSLKDKIEADDVQSLQEELDDMKADGVSSSITSIKTEYDNNGNVEKVTVGILDESTGEKTYKVYQTS